MFKFLKDKLKAAVAEFSKKVDEEAEEVDEVPEELPEEPAEKPAEVKEPEKAPPKAEQPGEEKKGLFAGIRKIFKKEEKAPEAPEEPEVKPEPEEPQIEVPEEAAPEEPEVKPEPEEAAVEAEVPEKPAAEVAERLPEEEPAEEEKPVPEAEAPEVPEVEAPPPIEPPPPVTPEAPKLPKKPPEPLEEPKGFLGRLKQKVIAKKLSEQQFNSLFWDIEVALLENNVAVNVIDKIKKDLAENLVDKPIARSRIQDTITSTLKHSLEGLFVGSFDLIEKASAKKPFVICFIGVNGSGKTTTIAKVAHMFKEKHMSCVLAAADTFRAAAIHQLKEHGKRLGVRVISQDYGSDAAAVAFDAIKHAQARNIDVVLIDTAGRLHSNIDLMDELKKVVRVSKPDMTIFVGESITGNDCVEQALKFDEAVGIDGVILSKADIDEKGGAAISVSYVTGKPIIYLGTGQEYADLKPFDSSIVLESLGL